MANTGVSHGEVKSICDSLECSPSQHQPSSSLYSRGAEPTAEKKTAEHGKSSPEKEKGFKASRKQAVK